MFIDNRDDIIDSRAVIERIEELEAERQSMPDAVENWPGSDEADELATLTALAEAGEQYCADWQWGATLVRRSYWTEYCREMVTDCDGMPRNLPSYFVIDWDATARNLEVDYTPIDFGGVEYLVR